MKPTLDREEELFTAAREIHDHSARCHYLLEACEGDQRRAERIQRLLDLVEPGDSFFADGDDRFLNCHPGLEGPGTIVACYRLLSKLGEGGMGVVYLAQQDAPVRRQVALKIIKLGMDTRKVVARFRAEGQALALMDHPNIAKVFDAGAADTGRPYFVMEYVQGVPITRYCDEANLSTRQRLALFVTVCRAVQHAHQKGIIHRDIKPGNILVTTRDAAPRPMIIDFGIAKATQQDLSEEPTLTAQFGMIGTPAYMSPEQALADKADIDTRSDIYSLGVLLFELLTGTTPLIKETLRNKSCVEIQRMIVESEAPLPSTRFNSLAPAERTALSRRRGADPGHLSIQLRQELDWIVMKALEPDRDRRYPTANALARDVTRYLEGSAVEAVPPTWKYQFLKLVRKRKQPFAAAAVIAVLLVAGSTVSTWQALRASRASHLAATLRTAAETERERADAQAVEALRQKSVAESINTWVTRDLLGLAYPWTVNAGSRRGASLTLQDAIMQAAEGLEERFVDQPEAEGKIRTVIADALGGIEGRPVAIEHYRRAHQLLQASLGANDTNTLYAQLRLGWGLAWGGAWKLQSGEEGEFLMRDTYSRLLAVRGPEAGETLMTGLRLGMHYVNDYQLNKAEDIITTAVETIERVHDSLSQTLDIQHFAYFNLAWLRECQARHAEARSLYHRLTRASLPYADPGIAVALAHYGRYLRFWDRDYGAAQSALLRGLEISTNSAGLGYPTPQILEELARLYLDQDDFHTALHYRHQHLINAELHFPPSHDSTIGAAHRLVAVYGLAGDWSNLVRERELQRKRGITDDYALATEILGKRLRAAEEMNLTTPGGMLWEKFAGRLAETSEARIALIGLVLWEPSSPRLPVPELPRVALDDSAVASHSLSSRMVRGLVDYRSYRFLDAERILAPMTRNLENRRLAVLAGYFTAMSQQHQGKSAQAVRELRRASSLLESLLRAGTLDPSSPPGEDWTTLACALVARQEAEILICGETHSAPVTADSLALDREPWKPVQAILDSAAASARQQDYFSAHDELMRALEHPEFDLETALANCEYMIEWVPVLLTRVGDIDTLNRFLHDICREDVLLPLDHILPVAYAAPMLSPAMLDRITNSFAAHTVAPETDMIESSVSHSWRACRLGMVLHGLGRARESLELLRPAFKAPIHDCSLNAKAYAGLAALQLGDTSQGMFWIEAAERELEMRVAAGNGTLDPGWWNLTTVDLAIQQAHALMDAPKLTRESAHQAQFSR